MEENWTQARWEKLNEAFGEGWEKECFPYLETGGWVGPAGQPAGAGRERDEAQWDAILEAVKLFKQTHGRFPRSSGGDADETRLYKWLQQNVQTGCYWTQERANKRFECFPETDWGVRTGEPGTLATMEQLRGTETTARQLGLFHVNA